MIKIYHRTIKDKDLNILEEAKAGSWIYVEDPSEEELNSLAEKYSLELGLLKDATDQYEVPRLEQEDGIVYFYTRAPFDDAGRMGTLPVLFAITEDLLITVSSKPLPFLSKFIDNKLNFSTTQRTKFLLQLFSQINSGYNSLLVNISRKVRGLTVRFKDINNRTITQFVVFEEVLNDYLAALVPTRTIFRNLLGGKVITLYEEDEDLIEDLALSTEQLIELSKSNLKTIVNIRSAYSTVMTNNINQVIKFLAALTIVLNVPMIISSFFGMNVRVPLANSSSAFWTIAFFTGIVSAVLMLVFMKNRWLK